MHAVVSVLDSLHQCVALATRLLAKVACVQARAGFVHHQELLKVLEELLVLL
jgi:hypothetical protein